MSNDLLNSLKSQLANLSYSTSYDYSIFGYSEEFGTSSGETLYASANEIVWGLGGDDSLRNSYSTSDQYLIGGSGNDTYTISGTATAIIYEAPNQGTNDTLYLSSNYLYYGYAASIDNKHLVAIYNDQAVFVLDGWENSGIENIFLGSSGYTSTYFLNLLPSLPGYLGNVSWDELKPYAGDIIVEAAKRLTDEIKSSTITVESDFENLKSSLEIQIAALEAEAAAAITDFEALNYIASYGVLISAFGTDVTSAKSHYIKYGKDAGNVLDDFDEWGYLASNNDLINSLGSDTTEAVKHYISFGYSQGKVTNSFNAQSYLNNYADLRNAFGNNQELATRHYVENGFNEGRTDSSTNSGSSSSSGSGSSSNLTDLEAYNYIASNNDLISAFGIDIEAAKSHYTNHGISEGRSLTTFSATNYLAKYSDLSAAFGSDQTLALKHYIEFGFSEGRTDTSASSGTGSSSGGSSLNEVSVTDLYIADYSYNRIAITRNSISPELSSFLGVSENSKTNLEWYQELKNNWKMTINGSDYLFVDSSEATDNESLNTNSSDWIYLSTNAEFTPDTSVSGLYAATFTNLKSNNLTDFEALNYIASYGDLINAFGTDLTSAKSHYTNHGKSEGRTLDDFDEWGYLASNNDLINSLGSDTTEAVRHYISFGYSQGKVTNSFNAQSYLNNYADLRNAFGNNQELATRHYVENGFNEGRLF